MRTSLNYSIMLVFIASAGANAASYKWKDANGVTQYSDQPPNEIPSKKLSPLAPSENVPQPPTQSPTKPPMHAPHGTSANDLLTLPPSNYAKLNDVGAVPYVNEYGRTAYKDFLQFSGTRAYLVCSDGSSITLTSKTGKLFKDADAVKKHDCKPYAVNDAVVWLAPATPPPAK